MNEILTKKTLEVLYSSILELNEWGHKKKTPLADGISEKYSYKKVDRKIKLPFPKRGLAKEIILDIWDGHTRQKEVYFKEHMGEFIENLAFLVDKEIGDLLRHQKVKNHTPAFIRSFSKEILSMTAADVNSKRCIEIKNENIGFYILRMPEQLKSPPRNKIIDSIDEDFYDFLSDAFVPCHEDDRSNRFKLAFCNEKKNRFERYKDRLSGEKGNSDINLNLGFLDDRDLKGEYNLFVLKNMRTGNTIYSCRTFSSFDDIRNEIIGQKTAVLTGYEKEMFDKSRNFYNAISNGLIDKTFVIDRLSGKRESSKDLLSIFGKLLFYQGIIKFHMLNDQTNVVCLARQEYSNSLLREYVKLGLDIQGLTYYMIGDKLTPHWVLSGRIDNLIINAKKMIVILNHLTSIGAGVS